MPPVLKSIFIFRTLTPNILIPHNSLQIENPNFVNEQYIHFLANLFQGFFFHTLYSQKNDIVHHNFRFSIHEFYIEIKENCIFVPDRDRMHPKSKYAKFV